MNLENLIGFLNDFSIWWLLRIAVAILFVGNMIFLFILGRQIKLMNRLFGGKFDFIVRTFNILLMILALLGFLMNLMVG